MTVSRSSQSGLQNSGCCNNPPDTLRHLTVDSALASPQAGTFTSNFRQYYPAVKLPSFSPGSQCVELKTQKFSGGDMSRLLSLVSLLQAKDQSLTPPMKPQPLHHTPPATLAPAPQTNDQLVRSGLLFLLRQKTATASGIRRRQPSMMGFPVTTNGGGIAVVIQH